MPAALGGGRRGLRRGHGPGRGARCAVLVEYAAPLLREGGVLVAWKGARDAAEEAAGAAAAEQVGMAVEDVLPVEPFAGAPRTAICTSIARSRPRRPASRAAGNGAQAPAGR